MIDLRAEQPKTVSTTHESHRFLFRHVRRELELCSSWNVPRVLVALSGGMDSSVLLHLMVSLRKKGGPEVFVAHIHHGVRGEDADRDAEHAEISAREEGCEFHLTHVQGSPSLSEAQLRNLRLTALRRIGGSISASRILLAHHADDQAETMIGRFFAGSDVRGLKGIPRLRNQFWVRPLLDVGKERIAEEAERCGIRYRYDRSNDQTSYRRNFIRKNFIPALRTHLNPNLARQLGGLARSLDEVCDYLTLQTKPEIERARRGETTFDVGTLREMHPALLSFALVAIFEEVTGRQKSLKRSQVANLSRLVRNDSGDGQLSLENFIAKKRGRILKFQRNA